MELVNYIKSHISLTDEDVLFINSHTQKEFYHKGDIIRAPHTKSQKIHYIHKGYARNFYEKNGKDITYFFLKDNSFTLPVDAVYFNAPTKYGLQAEEDLQLTSFKYSDLLLMLERIPRMAHLYELEMAKFIKQLSDKYYLIQFQSAQDRYNSMMEKYPDILLHVSLGHVASYLGITQETLSRIRTK
ncbi:Crp/Fnr family transcriptional regulator [Carboxylicivirga linearis]|uniref:Crp/Fnr family transcriptional regulator n=1 Tax=Carboxylicivirga linearis TaxID=1628157 RepID=A0ABS5JXJ8_9BACT|nr:Crp/Fnr family transcriptional regulator [Carboxylicivirga linearis]MBS2099647.1 Crp/Fnr family transcriptional regulator [Carboxylicivirga linearis]